MLIKCPECELQVSDKAVSCPHCGFPLQPNIKPRKPRNKNNKRRRLPNGFGQISEIKNRNLRNPFRAMISVGKDSNGRPICKPLKPESYFPTYNDAYAALVEYNKNPYDLEPSITMKELYEKWVAEYEKTVKSTRSVASAWISSLLFASNQLRIRQALNPVTERMPLVELVVPTGLIDVRQDLIVQHDRSLLVVRAR